VCRLERLPVMVNRWIGIVTLGLMLSANAALLVRDVLPDWLAGEPPESRALHLEPGDQIAAQLSIYDREGRCVGHSWTVGGRSGDLVAVHHVTILKSLKLPRGIVIPALRIDTDLNYHGQTSLDKLRVRVSGFGFPIRLEGEFYHPDIFACEWQVDDRRGNLQLPAEMTRALGDVIRPFESLTGLRVGQSWRVKVLNPLAGVIPDWGTRNMMTDTMLVRVTGMEQIEHAGAMVQAFVLEAEKLQAWVTPEGRVIRQELELPLFGTLTLVDEPYDAETRRDALLQPVGE
jgi:hypothetical protein